MPINIWTMCIVGTLAKLVPERRRCRRRGRGFWRNFAVSRAVRRGPKAAGPPFCPFLERVEASLTSFIYERADFCMIFIQSKIKS